MWNVILMWTRLIRMVSLVLRILVDHTNQGDIDDDIIHFVSAGRKNLVQYLNMCFDFCGVVCILSPICPSYEQLITNLVALKGNLC